MINDYLAKTSGKSEYRVVDTGLDAPGRWLIERKGEFQYIRGFIPPVLGDSSADIKEEDFEGRRVVATRDLSPITSNSRTLITSNVDSLDKRTLYKE